MKARFRDFYHSFPVQLLFLHLRKYQVLLLFWIILFSTVNGSFMKTFGADSLYLSPEYLGNVNSMSFALVGMSIAMFIMSWNIASFILFSRHFRFLAATTNPFLKYCINNSVLPGLFLLFYFYKAYRFDHDKELISTPEVLILFGGFLTGLILFFAVSFIYFFRADRSIFRRLMPVMADPNIFITHLGNVREVHIGAPLIEVKWYLESPLRIRPVRNVSHYTQEFVDGVFKRHHFAAILSILASFLFLLAIGFLLDNKLFELPAAASITIFFSILIGVAAAITYFLQSWSIPLLLVLLLAFNGMYRAGWVDPSNKAYGLNYENREQRPGYNRESLLALCSPENMEQDRRNMIRILQAWKKRQQTEKPLLVLMNTSGGGHRSATFTMSVLQQLDSLTRGQILKQTFLIHGASGGMIGAAYFRELYRQRQSGAGLRLQDKKYVDDIAGDLLNPLFSSFFARDLIAPAQKFSVGPYRYVKDRGYAFERQLNENTRGFLNRQLADYREDEASARIPLMFFNSVITRDSRKLIISTQPVRFMMLPPQDSTLRPPLDPDGVDFVSFFAQQDPYNLRLLSALRMNATFPVVLPNVWLPSRPVIDVMDAGLRDNYGLETTLRFLSWFEEWVEANTSGVVLIQIRDRKAGSWDMPYVSDDLSDHATKPFLLLQHNWFKMMEYSQNDLLQYFVTRNGFPVHKICFEYTAEKKEKKAALSFHLTRQEEQDIIRSVQSESNRQSFEKIIRLLTH